MTLAEALETLRKDIRDETRAPQVAEAQNALQQALQGIVRTVTNKPELWEPAALSVESKLMDQALSGDLPETAAPVGYVRTALTWRVRDLLRRAAVAKRDLARAEMQAAIDAADEEDARRRVAAWVSLRSIYAIVRRAMEAPHRVSNDEAMESLWHIHEGGLTLKELLVRLEPTLEGNAVGLDRAAARLHKSQQRVRAAITDETTAQVGSGRISEEAGRDILWLLATLRRRCPNRAPSRVPRP